MGGLNTATAVSAWVAILVSLLVAQQSLRLASRLATDTGRHHLQPGQSDAVVAFTNQYGELVRDGQRFDDDGWAQRYWALIATEFHFFDLGWLPSSIYELWTIELVFLDYDAHPAAWESHERHLSQLYAANSPRMYRFFATVHELAQRPYPAPDDRARTIARFVQSQHAAGRTQTA